MGSSNPCIQVAKSQKDSYSCQISLHYLNQGGQIMPILYWGPWLAKICRGGPVQ